MLNQPVYEGRFARAGWACDAQHKGITCMWGDEAQRLAVALPAALDDGHEARSGGFIPFEEAVYEVTHQGGSLRVCLRLLVGGHYSSSACRGFTFSRTNFTVSAIGVPGPNTPATPISLMAGMSSSGMMPPA